MAIHTATDFYDPDMTIHEHHIQPGFALCLGWDGGPPDYQTVAQATSYPFVGLLKLPIKPGYN